MEVNKNSCESCGMTIEAGPYCEYCTDEAGQLQQFDERFARLVQFVKRRDQGLSQEAAEVKTLEHMATMPAWRDHPRIVGRA